MVLNLQEFYSFISTTSAKLYHAVARYTKPRPLSFEDLLEISRIVVRDSSHILSREPQAPQPSTRVRQTDRVAGHEFVIASSTESSDLNNVEPTVSRNMPRRSDTIFRSKARQPSSTASKPQTAAAEGVPLRRKVSSQ